MLDDQAPLPFDLVTLRADNTAGLPTGPYTVADIPPEAGPADYELNHADTHPEYWDWAAVVTLDDIALITRLSEAGPHSWTSAP